MRYSSHSPALRQAEQVKVAVYCAEASRETNRSEVLYIAAIWVVAVLSAVTVIWAN